MHVFIPRFVGTVVFFITLAVIGTIGYQVIEGWSPGDAMYMTVITLTAVGYNEVRPLTETGRTFTMLLLGGGLTWMGLWFALITSFIVELDLGNVLRRRRIMREIGRMSGHVIVCGAGRTGRQVVEELEQLGEPWVVIENDKERIGDLMALIPDAYVIDGDATHDQTLIEAGIEEANGLVTCLSGDTDNLFVCLSSRDLNPELTIVARAYEESTMDKLYRAGASHVVSPNVSGAIRMASVLLRPSVVSFLDIATRSSTLALRMEQTTLGDDSPLAGKTLAEARIPQETGLIVIAVRKSAGVDDFVFNPVANTRLEPGDELIVLGEEEQIAHLREYAGA
jgi:voltage-gated potassium channel